MIPIEVLRVAPVLSRRLSFTCGDRVIVTNASTYSVGRGPRVGFPVAVGFTSTVNAAFDEALCVDGILGTIPFACRFRKTG